MGCRLGISHRINLVRRFNYKTHAVCCILISVMLCRALGYIVLLYLYHVGIVSVCLDAIAYPLMSQ
jgi:hypothetical protein